MRLFPAALPLGVSLPFPGSSALVPARVLRLTRVAATRQRPWVLIDGRNSQMNVYWVPLSKEDYVICRTFRVVVSQPLRLHLSQQLRPGAAEERFDLDKDESNHVLMKRSRHVHRLSAMVQVRRRDLFRPRWGCSYATRAARAARAGATMAQVSGGLHGEGTSRETHQGVMLTV